MILDDFLVQPNFRQCNGFLQSVAEGEVNLFARGKGLAPQEEDVGVDVAGRVGNGVLVAGVAVMGLVGREALVGVAVGL